MTCCGPSDNHLAILQIINLGTCIARTQWAHTFTPSHSASQTTNNHHEDMKQLQCTIINSSIPSAYAECDNSLPFSGASSIPLCYIPFPSNLFHQLVLHPPKFHLSIYFLVFLSVLLFPNSYIILFWKFYFLPFSVHAQTNVIYLTLLSLLQWVF